MGNIKEINIKIKHITFLMTINIEDFNPILLKIDKKSYKSIGIYYIGSITIKNISDCKSINSVNPLYFTVCKAAGHNEEKNGNKYLAF